MEDQRPIIVKRIKKVAGGHHGGSWKVAFADFATAMMAFFLVLWLMSTATPAQKKAIEGYFRDPVGFMSGGTPTPIDLGGTPQITVTPNSQTEAPPVDVPEDQVEQLAEQIELGKLEDLMKEIKAKIEESETLRKFKDQLVLDITNEGLRIQIVDKSQRPMFDSGSSKLKPYSEDILFELAGTIATVPNRISITGHTDATPYGGNDESYSNWELSADRANSARRALLVGGYPEKQVARIVGLGSSVMFDQKDPYNPVNRRIAIIVLNKRTEQEILGKEASDKVNPEKISPKLPPEVDEAIQRVRPVDPKELIW